MPARGITTRVRDGKVVPMGSVRSSFLSVVLSTDKGKQSGGKAIEYHLRCVDPNLCHMGKTLFLSFKIILTTIRSGRSVCYLWFCIILPLTKHSHCPSPQSLDIPSIGDFSEQKQAYKCTSHALKKHETQKSALPESS